MNNNKAIGFSNSDASRDRSRSSLWTIKFNSRELTRLNNAQHGGWEVRA